MHKRSIRTSQSQVFSRSRQAECGMQITFRIHIVFTFAGCKHNQKTTAFQNRIGGKLPFKRIRLLVRQSPSAQINRPVGLVVNLNPVGGFAVAVQNLSGRRIRRVIRIIRGDKLTDDNRKRLLPPASGKFGKIRRVNPGIGIKIRIMTKRRSSRIKTSHLILSQRLIINLHIINHAVEISQIAIVKTNPNILKRARIDRLIGISLDALPLSIDI